MLINKLMIDEILPLNLIRDKFTQILGIIE